MRYILCTLTVTITVLFLSLRAQAAMILQLDTAANTLAFAGTDTGTMNDFGLLGTWQVNGDYAGPTVALGNSNTVTFNGTPDFHNDFEVIYSGSAISNITIQIAFPAPPVPTPGILMGNPSTLTSYASMTAAQQADFESYLLAPSFVLVYNNNTGSGGFAPITVQAVPEPASLMLLGFAAAASAHLLHRRRRRD